MTNFSPSNMIAGGAILGALTGLLAAGWGHIKALAWRITGLMIQRVEFLGGDAPLILTSYLHKTYKPSRVYDQLCATTSEYLNKHERPGFVAYEQLYDRNLIFWHGWWPLFYSGGAPRPTYTANDTPQRAQEPARTRLSCLRGTFDLEAIITAAVEARNAITFSYAQQRADSPHRHFIKHVPDFQKRDNTAAQEGRGPASTLPWYTQGHCRLIGHTPDELGVGTAKKNALGTLFFPERVMHLIEEIKQWRNSREWYHKRGIPWKRGWLLYGPPGTGKTALARAFAEDLDLPIYVFNLAEIGNFEFMREWTTMLSTTPCIALIEDIDAVFHGRTPVGGRAGDMFSLFSRRRRREREDEPQLKKLSSLNGGGETPDQSKDDPDTERLFGNGQLSFDCLINMLDGVVRNDGLFTIITTNHIEHIDEALGRPVRNTDGTTAFVSSRPGRIDKAIELTHLTQDDKIRMATRIVGDYAGAYEKLLVHVRDNPALLETPAQFQERCAQTALQAFWLSKQPQHEEQPCQTSTSVASTTSAQTSSNGFHTNELTPSR